MKVTYSNSYDRSAGYVAEVKADEKTLLINLYYDAQDVQEGQGELVDGATIHAGAWSGKQLYRYSTLMLDLDEIRGTSAWQDRSVWTGAGRFIPDAMLPPAKHTKLWHNVTAETVVNKVRPTNHFIRHLRTSPIDLGGFLLYVPFKDSKLSECALHILSKIDGIPHLFNGQPVGGGETDPMSAQFGFMPRLSLTGPATVEPDGKVVLDIQLTDASGTPIKHDCDVYLETVGGYLPQTRILLKNGKAQARAIALGLEPGEGFRVKVGFKFWSGDDDHWVDVV